MPFEHPLTLTINLAKPPALPPPPRRALSLSQPPQFTDGSVVGRPSCMPSCLLGWCWRVQLWRARGGQTSAPARVWRADARGLISRWSHRHPHRMKASAGSTRPTQSPSQTPQGGNTTGGKQHRGETAHGETHPPTGSKYSQKEGNNTRTHAQAWMFRKT